MSKLIIKATENTPQVVFDAGSNRYEIRGRAFPNDTIAFFEELIDWFKQTSDNQTLKGSLDIYLEYYNTGTFIRLLEIFNLLMDLNRSDHDMSVNWYAEEGDEDSIANARSFMEVVILPFNLRTLPSIKFEGDL